MSEVGPYVRHWCAIYVIGKSEPAYRGTVLLSLGEDEAIMINAHQTAPASVGVDHLPITQVSRIEALGDPNWLAESNKAATMLAAAALLRSNGDNS